MNAPFSTIIAARHDAAARAVADYASIERTFLALPAAYQVRLIRRAATSEFSFSDDGSDKLLDGCDAVEADLRTDTLRNDEPVLFSDPKREVL